MDTRYQVSGMTCQHCVAHVREEVSAIPGVSGVDLTLDDGLMVVHSDAPIELAAISAAVEEAGEYGVATLPLP